MSASDPLAIFQRRANRHALEDGVADLLAGTYAILAGGATQRTATLALAVVYLAVFTRAWTFMHQQVAASRTGFADPAEQPHTAVLAGILGAAVLSLAVVATLTLAQGRLWDLDHWPTWAPVLAGTLLAAGFLHAFVRSGLPRWAAYACVSAGGGFAFWLYPFGPAINPSDRLTLLFFAVGGVLLVSGSIALVRFRRAHPVADEADHGA